MRTIIAGLIVAALGPLLWICTYGAMRWTGDPFAPFHPVFMGLSYLSMGLVPLGLLVAVVGFVILMQRLMSRPHPDA